MTCKNQRVCSVLKPRYSNFAILWICLHSHFSLYSQGVLQHNGSNFASVLASSALVNLETLLKKNIYWQGLSIWKLTDYDSINQFKKNLFVHFISISSMVVFIIVFLFRTLYLLCYVFLFCLKICVSTYYKYFNRKSWYNFVCNSIY